MTSAPRLASRLMWAQVLVVGIGALTPVIAAGVVAPRLFHMHLLQAGVAGDAVLTHAEAAFDSALAIAVTLGVLMSLLAAGLVSWFLVRRISAPIEALANAAGAVAAGDYTVPASPPPFSRELQQLTGAFSAMATQLALSDDTRTKMLADLAHELRTPLATLQAYIDGLEDRVIEHDAMAWSTMRAQVDRLRRLANDLREVAAADAHALAMTFERIDLALVTRQAIDAAMPRFHDKSVSLLADSARDGVWINGDALRLQQVLANLLDNSLRHTPRGGEVSLRLRMERGFAVIDVTDTGEGIPAEHLQLIFQRFHRIDAARETVDGSGSGLGLTIARAIVLDHGGSLTAESSGLGHGARFICRLPLASDLRA